MFAPSSKEPCGEDQRACIIDTGDRLTLDTSLHTLRCQPELLERVVSSLFDSPERRIVEVIIDRPSADNDA